jgi:hypothetical protein
MRSFSKERARDSIISFPLTAARGDRERKEREKREKEREIFPVLFPFFRSLDFTHKERARWGNTKTSPTRSFLSPFTLHTQKKKS